MTAQAEVAASTLSLAKRLYQAFGYDAVHIQPAQKGYRNTCWPARLSNGTTVNLILYRSEPGILRKIKAANAVSSSVAGAGLPARKALSGILKVSSPRSTRYAVVYSYLPGSTIAWEGYSRHHLRALGKTMSDMHAALGHATIDVPLDSAATHCAGYLNQVADYVSRPPVGQAMNTKLGICVPAVVLERYRKLLPYFGSLGYQQPLHMDFVRGNVVFTGVDVTGILDFEKTALGHPVFDIARTLAFLLVDCKYKCELEVRRYFLASGYQKHGAAAYRLPTIKTAGGGIDVLETLVNVYSLYDLYKFLLHNPYEYLAKNEHYIRTRDLLARRGLIVVV